MLDDDQLQELADDIRVNGLRQPIITCDGMILDGRNRFEACKLAGVEPHFAEFEGDDPLAYVVSLNLKRRHLKESQRALIAARIANMRQGARTDLSPIGETFISQADAAKMLNVGKRSVERAHKVMQEGTQELIKSVKQGEISVSAAVESLAHTKDVLLGVKPQRTRVQLNELKNSSIRDFKVDPIDPEHVARLAN
jgi:ParB-like chromosome segregation protein Spo0J